MEFLESQEVCLWVGETSGISRGPPRLPSYMPASRSAWQPMRGKVASRDLQVSRSGIHLPPAHCAGTCHPFCSSWFKKHCFTFFIEPVTIQTYLDYDIFTALYLPSPLPHPHTPNDDPAAGILSVSFLFCPQHMETSWHMVRL